MGQSEKVFLVGGMIVILLLFCCEEDIRRQRIPLLGILIIFPFSLLRCLLQNGNIVQQLLLGGVVGTLLFCVSRLTHQLGDGDALILGVLAVGLSGWKGGLLVMVSFFFAFLVALFYVVFFHAGRKKTIPFLPSILIAYILILVWGGG